MAESRPKTRRESSGRLRVFMASRALVLIGLVAAAKSSDDGGTIVPLEWQGRIWNVRLLPNATNLVEVGAGCRPNGGR